MGQVYVGSHEKLMKMKKDFEKGVKKEKKTIEKEISELMAKQVYEDTVKACSAIIDSWYGSYTPLYYKNRLYSLKDAIEVSLNGTSITIYGNTDALGGHHLSSEGLYNLTIENGSHGGSMYRGPLNYWNHPTRPAVVTFSPVDAINQWMSDYKPKQILIQKIVSIIRKHYSKYEYFRLFY